MPVFAFRRRTNGSSSLVARNREPSSNMTPLESTERSGLFVLHDCPANRERAVDIIAVHGLGGNWKKTWTKNDKLWLRDFLPEQLRDASVEARIMSYGYDSDTAFTKAVTDINDVAGMLLDRLHGARQSAAEKSRPILFIAHSLGGIVVKKLINIANDRPLHYNDLRQRVHGIVFLGVPHRGSATADWAELTAKLFQVVQLGFGTNTEFIQALKRNSSSFTNITAQFTEHAQALKIRTFFETERLGNLLIVDKDSATLGFPNEIAVGVAGSNHRTMCKFEDRGSQRYAPIWQAVQSLSLSAQSHGSASSQNDTTPAHGLLSAVPALRQVENSIFMVPFPRDHRFLDRPAIYALVEAAFKEGHPVALCGFGGVGKSQLAIEYAYRFREMHPRSYIFWVYAANITRFQQTYQDLARRLKIPGYDDPEADICQLACDWLAEIDNVPCLMILDNADNAAEFLPPRDNTTTNSSSEPESLYRYIPRAIHPSYQLLITTRHRGVGTYLSHGYPCVDVGALSDPEAQELLLSKIPPPETDMSAEVSRLLETLGRNALAITQAAAFINETKITLQQYVAELEIDSQSIIDHLTQDLQDLRREHGYPNSVFRTWKLSFDQLRAHHPRAAEILSLMAMLDGQQIPEMFLRNENKKLVDFRLAIGTLDSYSMITKEVGGNTCAIHPLVQLSIQFFLEQSGDLEFYRRTALKRVAQNYPPYSDENRATLESLLPHAQAVMRYEAISDDDKHWLAKLLYEVGVFCSYQENYDNYSLAHSYAVKSFELRESTVQLNVATLRSLNLVGRTLQQQGKYAEAEKIHRRVLILNEDLPGEEYSDTAHYMNDLASCLSDQEHYEDAETIYRELLALCENSYGKEHHTTLGTTHNLAHVLQKQEKYDEAEKLSRRGLNLRTQMLGQKDPATLQSMNGLAQVLRGLNRFDEAEEISLTELRLRKMVLGDKHPSTLKTMNNVALVLAEQEKWDEAEALYRNVYTLEIQVLGQEHPTTLRTLQNLTSTLMSRRKYGEAEDICHPLLNLQEKVLPADHPETCRTVSFLGRLYIEREMFDEGLIYHERALAGYEKALGTNHRDTLNAIFDLAYAYKLARRFHESAENFERVLPGFEEMFGEDHTHTQSAIFGLAVAYAKMGMFQESAAGFDRARAGSERVFGKNHANTAACKAWHEEMCKKMEDQEAQSRLTALEMAQEDHPDYQNPPDRGRRSMIQHARTRSEAAS